MWCYGSGSSLGRFGCRGEALDRSDHQIATWVSAMEAVFRRPIPVRMIDSPTFCHGVAGTPGDRSAASRGDASSSVYGGVSKARGASSRKFSSPTRYSDSGNIEYRGNQTDFSPVSWTAPPESRWSCLAGIDWCGTNLGPRFPAVIKPNGQADNHAAAALRST